MGGEGGGYGSMWVVEAVGVMEAVWVGACRWQGRAVGAEGRWVCWGRCG